MGDIRLKAYAAAAAVFALDRFTKSLIERGVSTTEALSVIPGFFDIVHSQNRGAAFGILNDSHPDWRTAALTVGSAAAVVVICAMLWSARRMSGLSVWGLALVLGGAIGNVFDRIVYGQVTDFLDVYVGSYHWPVFNVADSAIVIGGGIFVLDALRSKRQAANVP
jgi:signal peptidase II